MNASRIITGLILRFLYALLPNHEVQVFTCLTMHLSLSLSLSLSLYSCVCVCVCVCVCLCVCNFLASVQVSESFLSL